MRWSNLNAHSRYLVLAFMAAVTCFYVARVFAIANGGLQGVLEAIVFSGAAAFGLEYLISCWPSLWREG